MHKKGAIFYIIDAFVASAIIAITITVIFSTRVTVPESEQTKNVLTNYMDFMEKTTLREAPGTTAKILIKNNGLNPSESILEAIVELSNGDAAEQGRAQSLAQEVTLLTLDPQYGINITVWTSSTSKKTLIDSNQDRLADASTFLHIERIMTYHQGGSYLLTNGNIPISGGATILTGNEYCQSANRGSCIYMVTGTTSYAEDGCDQHYNAPVGVRCQKTIYPETKNTVLEVSLWS